MFERGRYPTVKELRKYFNSLSPEKDDWGAFIIPSSVVDLGAGAMEIFTYTSSETYQFSNNVYISLTSPEKAKFLNDETEKALKDIKKEDQVNE